MFGLILEIVDCIKNLNFVRIGFIHDSHYFVNKKISNFLKCLYFKNE